MPFLSTRLATDFETPSTRDSLFVRLLTRLLPAANPDFNDEDYAWVRRWWIEVDPETHRPEREIGFDGTHRPVFVSPLGENLGFWTDSDMVFDPSEHPAVAEADFEQAWNDALASIAKDKGLLTTDESP